MSSEADFDWVSWRFRENDPELDALNSRSGLRTLGEYSPGHAPTVFNPAQTGNIVPEATLFHEQTHAELMRTTAYGLFFEVLYSLRTVAPYSELMKLAFQHQWQTQEACATYAGLSVIAFRKPDYLDEAIARLPSARDRNPPYREVFSSVSAVLPIGVGRPKARLQAQAFTVTAIGRLSLDNDCLVRFADPERAQYDALSRYLEKESPNVRLQTVLKELSGRAEIERVVEEVEQSLSGRENPARVGMSAIRKLLPGFSSVETFNELKAQHATFRAAWQPVVTRLVSKDTPDRSGVGEIPAVDLSKTARLTLNIDGVRDYLVRASRGDFGLWMVVARKSETQILLDLMRYPVGENGNPLTEQDAARAVLQNGLVSGEFSTNDVVCLLEEFPSLPQAIMFMHGSWHHWEKVRGKRTAGSSSIQVCYSRELSEISLQVMLAFRGLRQQPRYFVLKYDNERAMACIVNANVPDTYGMQYLAGNVGLTIFLAMADKFGLAELENYESKVPHLALLKLMALPAFLYG